MKAFPIIFFLAQCAALLANVAVFFSPEILTNPESRTVWLLSIIATLVLFLARKRIERGQPDFFK